MCGKETGRSKAEILWWNEEVKETVSSKEMCQNSTVLNKMRYKRMKNKSDKATKKATRDKTEEELNE